ncbi:helix-turn-helix domain-containing protein [Niallia oryzisoli]|uniref:Helix-turn-helix domain-containing protein n=1 Tax=Niallia oryzisoli TaxID=1737571 RepID=A0ABZ2CKB2_9BACI
MTKKVELVKRLENHLRRTSRQLISFDTEEESLQFLTDSFRSEFSSDFVGIIIKDGDHFIPKVWSGALTSITEAFPLQVNQCMPSLLTRSMMFETSIDSHCDFTKLIVNMAVPTWFTVPLINDSHHYGFCVIGYFQKVKLIEEMGRIFDEFGKDVAVALALSKQKEIQKNKMMGMQWINQNLSLDASIEKTVEKLVERAGKETEAVFACIYLYDERANCFRYQQPSYGEMVRAETITLDKNNQLKHYFPYLETPGGQQLTVPLNVNLKTIGVVHVESKNAGTFTSDDLETLEFLSSHVAVMLENARLYQNEKNHKQKLHYLLDYQQTLIKETIDGNGFDGITQTLSNLFSTSVILLDRFFRPISSKLVQLKTDDLQRYVELAAYEVFHKQSRRSWFPMEDDIEVEVFSINGGGDLLGYIVLDVTNYEIDDYFRLSINLARNIYSIQFIKQRLVLDAKEQVKDSFLTKLFVEKIENDENIIQYANLFNWDPFQSHRVAILSLNLMDDNVKLNILDLEAQKSMIWDQLKSKISVQNPEILLTNKDGELVLIAPINVESGKPRLYWSKLYDNIKKWTSDSKDFKPFLAVGGKTVRLTDYYVSYSEALKALSVVTNRFQDIGFALFDELGSYTVLHQLNDSHISDLFIQNHLSPLLQYSEGKSMDLLQTLRVYLEHNGNIKETAEDLFIHRSSLLYRLEKITNLLNVDLNDSEQRFNLMMAYKLYDLYGDNSTAKQ